MVSKTLKEFEKRWEEISKKVERVSLENDQAKGIAESFLNEVKIFHMNVIDKIDKSILIQSMYETFNSLNVSLQLAKSNYERFAKPSLFRKIFGDKFKPKFNFDVSVIKNIIN